MALPVEPTEYPDMFETHSFGPFDEATVSDRMLMVVDKDTVIDRAWVRMVDAPAGGDDTLRLVRVQNGQTIAAAIAASQFVTNSLSLGGIVDNTRADMVIPNIDHNLIRADEGLAIDLTFDPAANVSSSSAESAISSVSTAMTDLIVSIRTRTRF